jgi:hypothetical protein
MLLVLTLVDALQIQKVARGIRCLLAYRIDNESLEKHYADVFQKVHFSNQLITLDQNSPHVIGTAGNENWENGEWSCTITVQGQSGGPIQLKGYHSSIAVREGDVWKKRMITWNITRAPAAPAKTAETK